ncbi:MAG TPA: extracellular solute-binding protein [Dongiaceae bacterium]|nr:extracellular solute-binding protein [Dongiaceae bacterium]
MRRERIHPTLQAARRFTRRSLLARAAASVAVAPMILAYGCGKGPGALNLLMWSDEWPDPVLPNFTAKTGITVNKTLFSQNEEQIAKLKAGDAAFDLCQPTRDRAPQFKELGVLRPWDLKKVPADALMPYMLDSSASIWTWDGGLYHLPHVWGTEAMAWRTDKWQRDAKDLSFGDLWSDDVRGHIQGRPHSMLLGVGLWMDATGKLPSNRMMDTFADPDAMKRVWIELTRFAVAHRAWVRQFWDSADDTKNGFLQDDIWLGQTWDGPALSLKKSGRPVTYMAPKEGAIAWLDGLALVKGAKNLEQVYALLDYIYTPEVAAQIAEGSGYNAVIKDAGQHLSDKAKQAFAEAYPDGAVENLWWRPPEPSWYADLRNGYADQFKSA